jgi:hypothetical protein
VNNTILLYPNTGQVKGELKDAVIDQFKEHMEPIVEEMLEDMGRIPHEAVRFLLDFIF